MTVEHDRMEVGSSSSVSISFSPLLVSVMPPFQPLSLVHHLRYPSTLSLFGLTRGFNTPASGQATTHRQQLRENAQHRSFPVRSHDLDWRSNPVQQL